MTTTNKLHLSVRLSSHATPLELDADDNLKRPRQFRGRDMPGGEAPHTHHTVETVSEQTMCANADAETETGVWQFQDESQTWRPSEGENRIDESTSTGR